jgi:hypothetical protein
MIVVGFVDFTRLEEMDSFSDKRGGLFLRISAISAQFAASALQINCPSPE